MTPFRFSIRNCLTFCLFLLTSSFLLTLIIEEILGHEGGGFIMHKIIEALYENGVLKSLTALDINEHEKIQVIIKEKTNLAKMGILNLFQVLLYTWFMFLSNIAFVSDKRTKFFFFQTLL